MSNLQKTPLSSHRFTNAANAIMTPPATLSRLKTSHAKKIKLGGNNTAHQMLDNVNASSTTNTVASDAGDAAPQSIESSLVTPLEQAHDRRPMIVDVSLGSSSSRQHLYSLSKGATDDTKKSSQSSWIPDDSPTLHRKISTLRSREAEHHQVKTEPSNSFIHPPADAKLASPLNTAVCGAKKVVDKNRVNSPGEDEDDDNVDDEDDEDFRGEKRPYPDSITASALKRRKRVGAEKENQPPDEIWSDDVEAAFAEALGIIPKKGLHKIKISGCAKGRNELISDYILAKTGKMRTRKQVSSHIQVIKNLRKDTSLIDLIVHGPPKSKELCQKFDEVFSRISLAKSLGPLAGGESSDSRLPEYRQMLSTPTRHKQHSSVKSSLSAEITDADLKRIDINIKRFRFNYIDMDSPEQSHNFSIFPKEGAMMPPLRIRTNADLTYRFPRFFELIKSIKKSVPHTAGLHNGSSSVPPVPILHGMVKMTTLPMDREIAGGQFNAGTAIQLSKLPVTDERFCCLTLIYSFGRLILSTFEKLETKGTHKNGYKDLTCEVKLGTNYWRNFFTGLRRILVCKLTNKTEPQLLSRAIKGITMKQVLFSVSEAQYHHIRPKQYNLDNIPKNSIRALLLWEFLRVEDPQSAVTTLRRIHLPVKRSKSIQLPRRALSTRKSVENGVPPSYNPSRSMPDLSYGCSNRDEDNSKSYPLPYESFTAAPNLAIWRNPNQLSPCYESGNSVPKSSHSAPVLDANDSYGNEMEYSAGMNYEGISADQSADGSMFTSAHTGNYSIPGIPLPQAAMEPEENNLEVQFLNLPRMTTASSDATESEGDARSPGIATGGTSAVAMDTGDTNSETANGNENFHNFSGNGVSNYEMMW